MAHNRENHLSDWLNLPNSNPPCKFPSAFLAVAECQRAAVQSISSLSTTTLEHKLLSGWTTMSARHQLPPAFRAWHVGLLPRLQVLSPIIFARLMPAVALEAPNSSTLPGACYVMVSTPGHPYYFVCSYLLVYPYHHRMGPQGGFWGPF